ncbi:MAG TPA: carbohydrate-binding domain-containing protein, partial [Pseudogracilibacillus sp.]|nr:carbohydrate-binding domain-containing protein [Pseudogracilibacillus sp.]
MKKIKKSMLASSLAITLALTVACTSNQADSSSGTSLTSSMTSSTTNSSTTATQVATSETDTETTTSDRPSVDWDSLETTEVTLTDDGLEITEDGTYILTGSTTGQVTVNTDGNVRIILNDATIKSSEGAAISIENAEMTVLELADGTENTVEDASSREDEEIDGAIYSSDDLVITGTGALTVNANFVDGIVSKDDLWIEGGTINVTSVDDGIRGKDSVTVSDGTITIDATDDGIKASNDTDLGKGVLTITGGELIINSGDDAVKAEQEILITGGTVTVESSVEGIEAPVIVIDD